MLPRHCGGCDVAASDQSLDNPRAETGGAVLVVDDEAVIRLLVAEVLEDLGCSYVEAQDGLSGLRLLESEQQLDLLITDVGLPGGFNGKQLAEAGLLLRPNLKILFITGQAEGSLLAMGEDGYRQHMHVLTKPFSLEQLKNASRHFRPTGIINAGIISRVMPLHCDDPPAT